MKEIEVVIHFNNGMNTREKVTAKSNEDAVIKVLKNINLLENEEVVGVRIITPFEQAFL